MEIFFTDYQLAALVPKEHGLVEALRSARVPDRMPFILASDGSYDLRLNRFLRELPHNGVRSLHSWKSYALDLLTWCRFLKERRHTTYVALYLCCPHACPTDSYPDWSPV